MPSDLLLDDTFVGRLGSNQHQFRDNPNPLSPLPTEPEDGVGVLQWRASRFHAGETFRINMYYEAAATVLEAGELPCSSGEGRVLRLAASIAAGVLVDLREVLTGLDEAEAGH